MFSSMEFLHVLTFLSLAIIASYAAVSPETYWKSVLPNSPMPKAITSLLKNENKGKNLYVGVGEGGVFVHGPSTSIGVGKGGVFVSSPGTNVGVGKGGGVFVNARHTNIGVSSGGVTVHAPGRNLGVSKGGVSITTPGTNVDVGSSGVSIDVPGTNVGAGKGGGVSVHTRSINFDTSGNGESNSALGTNIGVNGGGVSVHAPGTNVGVGKGGRVFVHAPYTNIGGGGGGGAFAHAPMTNVGVEKSGDTSVHGAERKVSGRCTKVNVRKGHVTVHCPHKGKPVNVEVSPFSYEYAATDDQLKDNPNIALFFIENDMHQGRAMNLHFTNTTSPTSTFLPRQIADKLPFSSKRLPEIYDLLSIKPDSLQAESIKKTIHECENKGIKGEKKYCATSLEAMIGFSTSELGKKVKAISTEVNTKKSTPLQKYTINGAKKLAVDKVVVCHKQKYAYAVFYCHKTITTKLYEVSLIGEDGTQVKAITVCHTDTAKWNPKHLAFKVLKVKPGTTPICHFLPEDHVVWIPY